jgi:hypothetical protein
LSQCSVSRCRCRGGLSDWAGGVAAGGELTLRNQPITAQNPRAGVGLDSRRLLIGRTDGGRLLTLVIQETMEPTTWLIVTGWDATEVERRLLSRL